jgi:glucokinase
MRSASIVHHLGIDIGGSSAKAALLDGDLRVRSTELIELVDASDDAATNRAVRLDVVARLIAASVAGGAEAVTVGVATPGIVDAAHRRIVALPGKLAGLEGLDWGDALRARLPPALLGTVAVLNDAHAAVLGEARLGAGRGVSDLAMLTLGTGVGGGVMIGGRLFEGPNRRAGHLGHLSLDPEGPPSVFPTPGSLEWHVGSAYAAQRTGGRYPSNAAIVAGVRAGEGVAVAAWRRMVRALAAAIASIIHAFDSERVIVGGGLVAVGALLFEPLARELAEVEWRPGGLTVPVVPAELGRHAGSIGAALFGRERSVPT